MSNWMGANTNTICQSWKKQCSYQHDKVRSVGRNNDTRSAQAFSRTQCFLLSFVILLGMYTMKYNKFWPFAHSDFHRIQLQSPKHLHVPKQEGVYWHPYMAQCAIVSSSGELLQQEVGHFINAHKTIIRVNASPIQGFEKWVGNRTDARLISNPEAFSQVLSKNMVAQTIFIRPRINNLQSKLRQLGATTFVIPECPQLIKYLGGADPTSGMVTSLMLSHCCSSLNLFGFVAHNLSAPYHYYGNMDRSQKQHFVSRERTKHGHKFTKEHSILNNTALFHDDIFLHADVKLLRKHCSFPKQLVKEAYEQLRLQATFV